MYYTCTSNALFPKYHPDPDRDTADRRIEYRKMDGEVRDIYTNTKTYPPQYFIAKYVQKEKENDPGSYFNNPYNPHDWNSPISHVRVYDIVNHGWRTLRVWKILTDIDGTPPLPTCSKELELVHTELLITVREKDRNSFKYYIDSCEYGSNHVLMTAIGPLISQYFRKSNLDKKRIDLHEELIEKVKNKSTNWVEKYQESLQDNQRLKKKLGKWIRKYQELMDKHDEVEGEVILI